MASLIKIKHRDGITLIETDIKTRIKCFSGKIKYIEKIWGDHASIITNYGYKKTYTFKGVK